MENERSQIYSKYNPRIPVFYWAFSLAYLEKAIISISILPKKGKKEASLTEL